jgi:charged multivesicular body protein 7
VINSIWKMVIRPGGPALLSARSVALASSAQNREQRVRMSSSTLSSLPSYNGLSNSRIQSLYSDISRQKHSNPTTYNANIAWWHSTLEAIVSRGWLPNTPDRLILHAEQSLLEALRYERIGKPLCLGTVTVGCFSCSTKMSSRPSFLLAKTELVNSRDAVPLQQFLTMLQSVHHPGWLPYRVAAFVVGKPLQWALHQLNLDSAEDESDTERWNRIKGDYVLIGVAERAADGVLALQRTRGVSLADTLYSFDSFRATFATSALPEVTLSDKDLRVLVKFLERDRRVVITEKEVRRSDSCQDFTLIFLR